LAITVGLATTFGSKEGITKQGRMDQSSTFRWTTKFGNKDNSCICFLI
jgi:hypothetical protein